MEIDLDREIVRHPDGSLEVSLVPERGARDEAAAAPPGPQTLVLRPGEGGYDVALAAWDLQQNPEPAVSTASGREQARAVVHAVATAPPTEVPSAVAAVDDPQAAAEALRHVLIGGNPSVADFAAEVAEAHGDDEPLPTHEVTRVIGTVLSELEGQG
jgi:hypothetical protein